MADKERPGKYGRNKRASRKRKRKYYSNQKLVVEVETESVPIELDQPLDEVTQEEYTTTPMSASAKIKVIDVPVSIEPVECNVVINTRLLTEFFIKLIKCPECGENVDIYHDNNKKGLAHIFVVRCTSERCDWSDTFSTSKTLASNQRWRKAYEINLRSCITFREIGRGYQSILNSCKLMNMPPPMDKKSYRKTFTKLYCAYSNAAYQSISKAAEDILIAPEADGIKNIHYITASFDGTWQQRGYSSGVVTCISGGKVLDYEVLCKVCPQCKYWNKKKTTAEYEEWKLYHDCTINHTGSAGSMEAAGGINIFKRSVGTKKLRYITYLGDVDSKSFKDIVESNIYPGHEVEIQFFSGFILLATKSVIYFILNDLTDVDPCTRGPVDPCTCGPVYPCTRGPVDPWTRVPVDPCTRVPVDPWTRVPVDPWTRVPVDPWTRG